MSNAYVSVELRRLVAARANGLCEYCLIDTYHAIAFQIDHIISEKHGGMTELSNLAHCCVYCNLFKGTDIGSFDQRGVLTRFYNPRTDIWPSIFG